MGTYILETTAYIVYSLPALLLCLPYGLPPAIRPHIALFSVPIYSLACAAGGLFPSLKKAALYLAFLSLFLFALNLLDVFNTPRFGLDESTITKISCTATGDSSLSKRGNGIVTVKLISCTSQDGTTTTAKGTITLSFKEDGIITVGEKLTATGTYSDGFFAADRIEITEKNGICALGEKLILSIEKRIAGDLSETEDAQILSLMLILGRAEDEHLYVRSLASECGCLHVLALSGMHLGLITKAFSPLNKRKRLKWLGTTLSTIAVAIFVFIAGPRPSLVRAAIMFLLSNIETKQRLALSFVIQSALLPSSVTSLGSVYSYCATSAIVTNKNKRGTALKVLLLTIPLQMSQDGLWHPAVLIAQIPAAFLAALSMANGFLILAFGRIPFLIKSNSLICLAMERLFETCSAIPEAGWRGYIILIASILTLNVVQMLMEQKNRRSLI